MKTLLNYFLRGLLFAFPLFATFYVISVLVNWVDNTLFDLLFSWINVEIPGLGIVTAFLLLALFGFFVTKTFLWPLFTYFDRFFSNIPLFSIIYTAFKDFTEAFVGNKKKFNRPVVVTLMDGVDRIGFITDEDLSFIGLQNRMAVYCPHSYNFSGNLYMVDPKLVKPLDIEPSEAMKFAVSAGITKIKLTES